jgi:hypothetical protein
MAALPAPYVMPSLLSLMKRAPNENKGIGGLPQTRWRGGMIVQKCLSWASRKVRAKLVNFDVFRTMKFLIEKVESR